MHQKISASYRGPSSGVTEQCGVLSQVRGLGPPIFLQIKFTGARNYP